MKPSRNLLLIVLLTLAASACSKESEQSGQSPDWKRGRAVYVANCVACHNNDPSKDGPIGPAIKGSPPELIESRVLRTQYPRIQTQTKYSGYAHFPVPQNRDSLSRRLPALTGYLKRPSAKTKKIPVSKKPTHRAPETESKGFLVAPWVPTNALYSTAAVIIRVINQKRPWAADWSHQSGIVHRGPHEKEHGDGEDRICSRRQPGATSRTRGGR